MSSSIGLRINNSGAKKKIQVSATPDYSAGVIQKIKKLFDGRQFCDVALISETDQFKVEAHKLVLSAASPYFLAMFGGSLREASAKEVKFKQIDGHTLKVIVNFIYTSSIELTTDTVEDIIKTAHLFQLDSLEVLCCDFIAGQLDSTNCIGIALFAEHYNFKTLYTTAETFVCQHFMQLRNGEEFFLLNSDQLGKVISRDELCLSSEEEVFHAIMSWVEHDKPRRKEFIGKLLNQVRFPLLSPKFIASTVERACNSIECERLVYKALKWHSLPEFRPSLFPEKQTKLRNFKDLIIAISGWNNTNRTLSVGLYYSGLSEWIYKEWPAPSVRRVNFGSTTIDGKLIIAGGTLTNGEVTNSVECLDMRTLKWTKLAPMTTNRHSFKMATLNGQVYAIGGQNQSHQYHSSCLNSMEKWDPLKAQWQSVAPIREASSNFRVAVRFNKLCVSMLHRDYYNHTFTHIIYDPKTNAWTENWLTTNGDLMGTGAWRNSNTDYFIAVLRTGIIRYKIDTKSSQNISNNSIKAECKDCEFIGDRIIVYGDNEFQEYNLSENKWKQMPRFTSNHGKVIVISS